MANNDSGKNGRQQELPVIEKLMIEKPPSGRKMENKKGKAPKPQAGKKNTASKPEKKSKGTAIVLIFLFLLLAAGGTVAYFSVANNLFGGRDYVIEQLNSVLIALDWDYKSLAEKQAELELREAAVLGKEEELEKKEQKLKDKEAAASVSTGGSLSNFENLITGLTEERKTQIQQISAIYTGMEPKKAADAVAKLSSLEDMALVVYFMKEKSAAEVMAALTTDTAARITAFMLN